MQNHYCGVFSNSSRTFKPTNLFAAIYKNGDKKNVERENSNSIRLNPLVNPITTEIANACDVITAAITLIKDLMSNNDINLIISGKLKASENFPLCRYLFNNPAIKHI